MSFKKSVGVPYVLDIIGGKVIGEGVTYPSTLPQALYEAEHAARYKGRTQVVVWLRVMCPGEPPKVELVAVFEDDGAILSDEDAVVKCTGVVEAFFSEDDSAESDDD